MAFRWFDLCQAEIAGLLQGSDIVLILLVPAALPLLTGLAGKNGTFYNHDLIRIYLFNPGQVTVAAEKAALELLAGRKYHDAVRLRGVHHRQFGYLSPLLQSDAIQRYPLMGVPRNRQYESPP